MSIAALEAQILILKARLLSYRYLSKARLKRALHDANNIVDMSKYR